ncbi:MAG: PqqD family protein [Eubacterium sp.]
MNLKIKSGFTLRNVSGEHIVMPTGRNISQFNGAIILNDVSAFIWEKLSEGCSREELLVNILSKFKVDRERAEKDLDALLEKLREYDVIEEQSV